MQQGTQYALFGSKFDEIQFICITFLMPMYFPFNVVTLGKCVIQVPYLEFLLRFPHETGTG